MLMKYEEGKFINLQQTYSWESSCDIYRDVDEAVEEIREQMGIEHKGNIKVVITYEE